ncbi:MAG: DUF4388 domain-containing protein [Planctomycetota bacterium]|nr:DUF4388 domain-containing protein [Planctomycetota bacterium]
MSSLRGHLEHFGLQELLQTLSHSARTGTLQIERDKEKVSIVFETGHITLVRSGSSSRIRLRSILLRGGVVSEEQLLNARQDQQQTGMLLGRALIERGIIDDAQLSQALRLKLEEELFDLFLWESGTFEFFPELLQSAAEDEIQQVTRIQVDPMSIIIEGLRQADEWKLIRDRIKDLRWILKPVDGTHPPAESHSMFMSMDGHRSIDELLSLATSTRFDTCSILYRFIEEGKVREASAGEMIEEARSRKNDRPASSLSLYEALIDRAGSSMGHSLLEEAAECAAHHDHEAQARFLRRAVEILKLNGDGPGAWIRLQRLLILAPGTTEDLQVAWALRQYIPTRRVHSILDDLVRSLRRTGEHRQIVSLLKEAESIRGSDARYWLQLGEEMQRIKDPAAEKCLAQAIRLADKNSPEIALRAERILRELNSDLALHEDDLEQLRQRRNAIDSIKKIRHWSLIGATALCFIICLIQVSSEWRARGLLSAARSIEASTTGISGLTSAALAFERVANEHPWTFAASAGVEASARLTESIDHRLESEKSARSYDLQRERDARKELLGRARKSIQQARDLRNQGDVIGARALLDQLDQSATLVLSEIEIKSILIPVQIESRPTGARVLDSNQKVIGNTPMIVDLTANAESVFFIERSGCRTKTIRLSGDSPPVVQISLVRGPLRTFTLPSPVQNAVLAGDFLVLSGRDGQVRVVDVNQLHVIGEHIVGIDGHPAALLVEKKGEVLAVPYSGRAVIVEPEGDLRALGPTATAPWTAACSLDAGWVLADAAGLVVHLDSGGKTIWEFHCDAPVILMSPSTSGGLYVIDQTRLQHEINASGKPTGPAIRLPGEVNQLLPDGRALLQDGTLWSHRTKTVGPAPSTSLRHQGLIDYYGTKGGWATVTGSITEEHKSPYGAACAPLSAAGDGASTWVAGVDGILRLHDSNDEIAREVELGAAAVNLQRSRQGRILVTLADGRLCDVEELEK